jgi:hypothetical protein
MCIVNLVELVVADDPPVFIKAQVLRQRVVLLLVVLVVLLLRLLLLLPLIDHNLQHHHHHPFLKPLRIQLLTSTHVPNFCKRTRKGSCFWIRRRPFVATRCGRNVGPGSRRSECGCRRGPHSRTRAPIRHSSRYRSECVGTSATSQYLGFNDAENTQTTLRPMRGNATPSATG